MNYTPAATGLLSDFESVAVSLEIVDQRPEAQRENIGIQRDTVWGSQRATVVSSVPEIEVIRSAVETELERSGHRLVTPGQGPAAMSLRVALTQFLFDSQGTADTHIELVGIICADVTASVGSQGHRQVSFAVESAYRDFVQAGLIRPMLFGLAGLLFMGGGTHKSDIEKTMNGVLAEFVRQLCLEPKLRQVFADATGGSGLSPAGAQTYAKQPTGVSPPAAGSGPDSREPGHGNQNLTEVEDSGWVESISVARTTSQGVRTANVLHATRDYLLKFRPDCVVKVSEDPLIQEIAIDRVLQFFQGTQHQFTVRGYVGSDTFMLTPSEVLPVLEVFYLEKEHGETGRPGRS